jgi:hypothetical protein
MNSKQKLSRNRWWVFFTVWALLFSHIGLRRGMAEEPKMDISAILHDTQKTKLENQQVTIVWWIPELFWKTSFANSGTLSDAQREKFLSVMRPYLLVAVMHGDIGVFGATTYEDEKVTRRRLTVVDQDGNSHKPIATADYSPDLDSFLAMMKPVLAQSMGRMGQNLNFYVFDAKNEKGLPIANPTQEGKFSVMLGEDKFTWRLPLGSLLPPKICPKCGDSMSGSFKFCPFDGTPLAK